MIINRSILAALVCIPALAAAGAASAVHPASPIIWSSPFTSSVTPWVPSGNAQFRFEDYQGYPCLKIVVDKGVPLSFAHFKLPGTPVAPSDVLQADVWVRTAGVSTGLGPYIALVLHNAAGTRTAVSGSVLALSTGANGWQKLEVTARAPVATTEADFNLLMQAHGTVWFRGAVLKRLYRAVPWPNLGSSLRTITVYPHKIISRHILGPGFVVYHQTFHEPQRVLNRVIFRRWMELRPSFARMAMAYSWKPGGVELNRMARYLQMMKVTHTVVYVTTWNPPVAKTPQEVTRLAAHVVKQLQYLVDVKKCTNIHYYCFTNELTLGDWGSLMENLPLFGTIQQAVYNRLQRTNLHIGLLSTDASPISYWSSIKWAAAHINAVTAIYGGHNYPGGDYLSDDRYYPWLLQRFRHYADIAKSKHKQFVLGEFGSRGDGRTVNGVHLDSCVYFGTPLEPLVGTQLAEITIAALNSGMSGMTYWTFMDLPQGPQDNYQNHWGLTTDVSPYLVRAPYYAYGLMTRFLHGPADVLVCHSSDPRLRVAVLHRTSNNRYDFAIVNRNRIAVKVRLVVPSIQGIYAFYQYNPKALPITQFGTLQRPYLKLQPLRNTLTFVIPAGGLIVCSQEIASKPPSPVSSLTATPIPAGGYLIRWRTSQTGPHFARIYRSLDRGNKEEIAETAASSIHLLNAYKGERIAVTIVGDNSRISRLKSVLCK